MSSSADDDDVTSQRHFGRGKVQQRLRLSDDLRDVYDLLQKVGNGGKNNDAASDSTMVSEMIRNPRPRSGLPQNQLKILDLDQVDA